MNHYQTNKRRHPRSGNGGSLGVHRIVTNVAMLAINDDALYNHENENKPHNMRDADINASLSNDLGCAKGWKSQKVTIGFELREEHLAGASPGYKSRLSFRFERYPLRQSSCRDVLMKTFRNINA
jgi:hypothetical protein